MPKNPYLKWYQSPLYRTEKLEEREAEWDQPSLEESPWEARLRGFGAGALQGLGALNEYLTPENLVAAGIAAATGTGMARAGAGMFSKTGRAVPGAVQGLQKALPALGEVVPEFTAVGAEGALNVGRAGVVPKAIDPVAQAYSRILARGGR